MIFVPLCLVTIVAIVASLWSSGNVEAVDIWIAIRRLLALGLFHRNDALSLDRFFRWRLYWEACRRARKT